MTAPTPSPPAKPARPARFLPVAVGAAVLWLGVAAALLLATPPARDGGIGWTEPMAPGGWMAWTLATAAFFHVIAGLLVTMIVWTGFFPQAPRMGVLRLETTPGDRLFISLLGSAFICLAWLALIGAPLWGALGICLVWALAVFRYV